MGECQACKCAHSNNACEVNAFADRLRAELAASKGLANIAEALKDTCDKCRKDPDCRALVALQEVRSMLISIQDSIKHNMPQSMVISELNGALSIADKALKGGDGE